MQLDLVFYKIKLVNMELSAYIPYKYLCFMTTFIFFLLKQRNPAQVYSSALRSTSINLTQDLKSLVTFLLYFKSFFSYWLLPPQPVNTLKVSFIFVRQQSLPEYSFLLQLSPLFPFIYSELAVRINCFHILISSLTFHPLRLGVHVHTSLKLFCQRSAVTP